MTTDPQDLTTSVEAALASDAIVAGAAGGTLRASSVTPEGVPAITATSPDGQPATWRVADWTGDDHAAALAMGAILERFAGQPLAAGWCGPGTPGVPRDRVDVPDAAPYRYDDLWYVVDGEAVVPLANGMTLRCDGTDRRDGQPATTFVRVCLPDHGEEGYWTVDEWADPADAEETVGAIVGACLGGPTVRVPPRT